MFGSFPRRTFLQQAAMAAACTALPQGLARAIEPIARNGAPKFKFSLAAYSYRELLQAKEQPLTLFDFIDDCARFGLEGAELTSYYFKQPVTPEYLRELRARCFRLGLDVSGTAVGNDFGQSDAEKHKAAIAGVKKFIEQADMLGAPVIRVFAGKVPAGRPEAEVRQQMVAALEECCEFAGKYGIFLALENHGGPTATVEGLLQFVTAVKSPWFAVNLDSGNFHSADVYADLARIAPYAMNVQVKVTVSGPDGKHVPSDYSRLAKILRESAYRGYIVLEFEEKGDVRTECEQHLAELRKAFA